MTHLSTHSPVLGTVVELRIEADATAAARAEAAALAEFERLEAVFSTYRPDSLLCQWRSGELATCPDELAEVLTAAAHWHRLSGGAFHPATRDLTDRWRRAVEEGHQPPREEMAALAGAARLPYAITAKGPIRTADCSGLDLNAIAKGYIVDCATEAALRVPGVSAIVVNAGGDLRHQGVGSLRVGIEDPSRPFDNLPPRWTVPVANNALATSGSARRGFEVAGQWLGHVIDPRTGWPVAHTASISVLAADAMTADALATVLGVLTTQEAAAFADQHTIGSLLVAADGTARASATWPGSVH
jgi:FAD:protein FMN transferase